MSMLQGASQVAITGGTQVAIAAGSTVTNLTIGQTGISSAFKDLSASAAHAALHDSSVRFNAPRCHRNTRTTYLDSLELWMLGQGEEYANARLIWLNGGAGAGKSAIMQSIVERCAQYGVILGTFFFSRTDPSRNYAEVLIPTLAYQLARVFPAAMAVLGPMIERDPLIFKASLQTQAHELLIRPLQYLIATGEIDSSSPLRRVFVIDGLDECDDPEKQALIIHVISTVFSNDNLGSICFLFASRPEIEISRAFQREHSFKSILSSITLQDGVEASSDIRQFIEDSFLDILDTHPLRNRIPSSWPKSRSIDELVRKSSGHFIYAATAMKFISSSNEHPTRALQVVEGLVPSRMGNPFAELDALYLHILSSAKYSSQVLEILRLCVLTKLDNSVAAICFMYPNISPDDVALFLSDVEALVSLSPDNNAEMYVLLKHASLSDFFKDANRSHAIFMNERAYKASLLPRYFQLLDRSAKVGTPSLYSQFGQDDAQIPELSDAIHHSQDVEPLQSLIYTHPPQNVWDIVALYHLRSGSTHQTRNHVISSVSRYMNAVRDSVANHDKTLYIHQFEMFIQLLIDDLNKLIQTEPQYRLIPALIFSSSPSCLTSLVPLLIECFPSLNISWGYAYFFHYLQPKGFIEGVIDPRTYEVIKRSPQSQRSWGSDLAPALKLVLQHLVGSSWTPEFLHPNPHRRWLQRMKSLKHMSQGSPKLSSTFYSYLRRLPTPSLNITSTPPVLDRYMSTSDRAVMLWHRREECFVLLKTVICYLHKSHCTSDIARLARKSLPKAALWFPRLMKKARRKMDAYVRRWEESPDGLLEKTQALFINDLD